MPPFFEVLSADTIGDARAAVGAANGIEWCFFAFWYIVGMVASAERRRVYSLLDNYGECGRISRRVDGLQVGVFSESETGRPISFQ